mgnify:FL=1
MPDAARVSLPKLSYYCCVTETETRRVFFSLWPPAVTLQAIDALANYALACCGGRRTQRDNLHLTLAFIGSVTPGQLEELKAIAGSIRSESFEWQLDRVGYWPHNHIVWAGCSPMPVGPHRLFESLYDGLTVAGFSLEARHFVPHVTLLRKVRCDKLPELMQPISWPVIEFVLVESVLQTAGARYRTLERYPLFSAQDKKSAKEC